MAREESRSAAGDRSDGPGWLSWALGCFVGAVAFSAVGDWGLQQARVATVLGATTTDTGRELLAFAFFALGGLLWFCFLVIAGAVIATAAHDSYRRR